MKTKRIYKKNVASGFKLLLDWGPDAICNRRIKQKLEEVGAKRGNQRMLYRIINFLLDKDLYVTHLVTGEYKYTIDDIPELTETFLSWDKT